MPKDARRARTAAPALCRSIGSSAQLYSPCRYYPFAVCRLCSSSLGNTPTSRYLFADDSITFFKILMSTTYVFKRYLTSCVYQVVRAASPVLLRVIILGAFFIYCTVSLHSFCLTHVRIFVVFVSRLRCKRYIKS